MIKNYADWLNESYDPPDDPVLFVEQYENLVTELEQKMQKEGINVDSETFLEKLQFLDVEQDFFRDIDEFIHDNYQKMYIGNYNSDIDDNEFTQEYRKMYDVARAEAEKKFPSVTQLTGPSGTIARRGKKIDFYKKRKHFIEEQSYRYLIDKKWSDYKKIYQKYLDFIHSKRGMMQGKKFGL